MVEPIVAQSLDGTVSHETIVHLLARLDQSGYCARRQVIANASQGIGINRGEVSHLEDSETATDHERKKKKY
jgi:hypothetical protein